MGKSGHRGRAAGRVTAEDFGERRRLLQQPLFLLFLAFDAVAGPRHSFEAFLLQFFLALDAQSEGPFANALQGFVNQLQQSAIVMRLPEEKFLGVGVRGLVREVYRRILIRLTAFLAGADDGLHQLFAPGLQLLFVIIQPLLIHSHGPRKVFRLHQNRTIVAACFPVVNLRDAAFLASPH